MYDSRVPGAIARNGRSCWQIFCISEFAAEGKLVDELSLAIFGDDDPLAPHATDGARIDALIGAAIVDAVMVRTAARVAVAAAPHVILVELRLSHDDRLVLAVRLYSHGLWMCF